MKRVAVAIGWAGASVLVLGLAGCANGPSPLPSLTTGSLFGKSDAAATAAAVKVDPYAPLPNTPNNRAIQAGTTSARAVKCGFNFDVAAAKSKYLASESQAGTPVEELAKVDKIYGASYNAVARAVAKKENYCHDAKTKLIKADLTAMLAGDYTPQRLHPKEEDDGGLLVGGTQFVME